ncbi:hypothetical protein RMN56_20970 [Micromonospora halotolerans]|uniref:Uncharacterized protein n=1 Tax=Micromonospora halotolerans TaxID=709879 RepID=A0ABY9ZR08_9ACTN|nr:hypothetical protein [Micromonospora halotolerans]WNM37625.1 hypothetical protein RMN56_20970 [Micromonospora halotolerans]
MIAASILLILVAVVLLVAGLAAGSSPLLITSIAVSLLAAVALVAFARQAAAARATVGRETGPRRRTAPAGPSLDEPEVPVPHITSPVGAGGPGWRQPPGPPVADVVDPPAAAYGPPADPFEPDPFEPDPVEPPAEPYSPPAPRGPSRAEAPADAPTPTSPAPDGPFEGDPPTEFLTDGEVARLVRLDGEVRVVDGHPRFHLPGCPQLVGRADEPLPVAEAVGLGFTPCGRCAPATTLLAEARPR